MTRSATVRVTKDVRPRRPKVDRGEEIEQLVRRMYTVSVDEWCKDKENLDEMPNKEVRSNVVDNLTASFTSTFETLLDASTDSYLSTTLDEGGDIDCPKCGHEFDPGDDVVDGDETKCPECKHEFIVGEPDEVEVECPDCDHSFDPGDVKAGAKVHCPKCGTKFVLEAEVDDD